MPQKSWRTYAVSAIFLVVLVWVAFFGAYSGQRSSRPPPSNQAADAGSQTKGGQNQPQESYWVRATEPVALFTLLVAAFTGVLGVSTVALWRATKRSVEIAERALTDLERPWVFRDIVSVSWRHRPGVAVNDWWVKLKWKNVGRAPALLSRFEFKFADVNDLPASPDYSGSMPLGILSALPQRGHFETQAVGPARGTKPDGTVIQYVFFGRLLYTEMNGKEHRSGFALLLAPHFPHAAEHSSDAYNYYT